MKAEITFDYSPPLVETALRRYWFRHIGWDGIAVFSIATASLLCLILQGDYRWYVQLLATLLGLWFLLSVVAYLVSRHRTVSVFRLLTVPKATFRFDDDGIATNSDLGGSQLQWKAIRQLWRFPDLWLFIHGGQYWMIPTTALPEDLRRFVIERVESAGGKVR